MKSFQEWMGHIILQYLVVPKAPAIDPSKKHIACIGDSITFGAGVQGKDHDVSTWEYFLQQKVGDRYQVLNYGISGRTLLKEGDYPYTAEKFYHISREAVADIYIIMLGTNDSKPYNWDESRFLKELPEFCNIYRNNRNHPDIYVMMPPECFVQKETGIVGYDILEPTIREKICPAVKEYAEKSGVHLINLFDFTKDHPEWFDDGVHPNAQGNREIAECIYQALKESVK